MQLALTTQKHIGEPPSEAGNSRRPPLTRQNVPLMVAAITRLPSQHHTPAPAPPRTQTEKRDSARRCAPRPRPLGRHSRSRSRGEAEVSQASAPPVASPNILGLLAGQRRLLSVRFLFCPEWQLLRRVRGGRIWFETAAVMRLRALLAGVSTPRDGRDHVAKGPPNRGFYL